MAKSPADTGDAGMWVPPLAREDPLEGILHGARSSLLLENPMNRRPGGATPQGCKVGTRLSTHTQQNDQQHFYILELVTKYSGENI